MRTPETEPETEPKKPRTRTRARALLALLLTAALITPALTAQAADTPPTWNPTPTASVVTADYRIEFFEGTATTGLLDNRPYATPSPVFTFEIENRTATTQTYGLGMDLDTAGTIVPFWQPSTWQTLGEDFAIQDNFVITVEPGQTVRGFDPNGDLSFPRWSGRTVGVFTDPTTAPTEVLRWTMPGRYVPVRFGDPDGYFNVGIGSPTRVSAPNNELFPGVSATITADDLTPGDTLNMYLVDEMDYFYFYLSMAALPADAVAVGSGTVAANGTFSGTFVVPPDLPLGDRYQLLLGDPADNYWPAGGYDYFSITTPSVAASASTPTGASTATLPLSLSTVTMDFPAGTTAGTTSAAVSATGPTPEGFTLASDPPLYYHLDSTATPGGPVTVCITYDPANLPGPAPYLYHHETVPPSGYRWTNITTTREAGRVCGVTTSFSPFTLGIPDAPPDDGSLTVPAKGVLSTDNGWDTGLKDGDYNVTMNLWSGENTRIVRLLENGTVIAEQTLTRNTPKAQRASFAITGKANGSYVYTAELENSRGVTRTAALTVKVTDANPGKVTLSDDNSDKNGTYVVTADMRWGTNATSYTFRENGVIVGSGTLTAATPSAQHATLPVSGKAKGNYVYTVTFTNAAGETTSAARMVKVSK